MIAKHKPGWAVRVLQSGIMATTMLTAATSQAATPAVPWTVGVNWAGAEFAGPVLPGVEGTN